VHGVRPLSSVLVGVELDPWLAVDHGYLAAATRVERHPFIRGRSSAELLESTVDERLRTVESRFGAVEIASIGTPALLARAGVVVRNDAVASHGASCAIWRRPANEDLAALRLGDGLARDREKGSLTDATRRAQFGLRDSRRPAASATGPRSRRGQSRRRFKGKAACIRPCRHHLKPW